MDKETLREERRRLHQIYLKHDIEGFREFIKDRAERFPELIPFIDETPKILNSLMYNMKSQLMYLPDWQDSRTLCATSATGPIPASLSKTSPNASAASSSEFPRPAYLLDHATRTLRVQRPRVTRHRHRPRRHPSNRDGSFTRLIRANRLSPQALSTRCKDIANPATIELREAASQPVVFLKTSQRRGADKVKRKKFVAFTVFKRFLRDRRIYSRIHDELSSCTDRELRELGFERVDIARIARQAVIDETV